MLSPLCSSAEYHLGKAPAPSGPSAIIPAPGSRQSGKTRLPAAQDVPQLIPSIVPKETKKEL